MITAFIPLATTGEVALFVGALAAVEHQLGFYGSVGAGAWVAGASLDDLPFYYGNVDAGRTAAGIRRQLIVGTPVGGELAVGVALDW